MADLKAFRAQTREWLDTNCPASMRTPTPENEVIWGGRNAVFVNPDSKIWLDRMAEKGWTCPTWPKEYGGGGLNPDENRILAEEMGRIRARIPLNSFGIWMLGPALLEFASEEQKKLYLPQIARGQIRWCQGYSEPGYGSDLAGLQTKAEDKGDFYLVNGSKIWTSYADQADWIFCLVRTNPDVSKHDGISFLLFNMESEGISTSPIKLISGVSPFCQTFFDNVKVPKSQLVGELNKGWTIAKRLLQHERNHISAMGGVSATATSRAGMDKMAKSYVGDQDSKIANPSLRARISKHQMNERAFQLTMRRSAEDAKAGNTDAHLASMAKYYGTEQNKSKYELQLDILGTQALGWEGDMFSAKELDVPRQWLRSKANSIEGGTSEVQLNIIAKRVLGLPD